jgi:hypothetical protein
MKRWRDEQQTVRTAIKSIVLQVLVSQCMPHIANDADRLAGTFRNLYVHLGNLSQPPVVANPVLDRENLAKRWTMESFRNFRSELAEAVEWAEKAGASADAVEAADAWREVLGEDFPVLGPDQLGFRVGDFSHADTPRLERLSTPTNALGKPVPSSRPCGLRMTRRRRSVSLSKNN